MDARRFTKSKGDYTPPSLTLVLPAFNEEAAIAQSIREADEALSTLTSDYEILVVDDGCTDNTAHVVENESLSRPSVRLLRQPKNLGYGAALARGFCEATKDLVCFSDSDCQFDLRELESIDISVARLRHCVWLSDRPPRPPGFENSIRESTTRSCEHFSALAFATSIVR